MKSFLNSLPKAFLGLVLAFFSLVAILFSGVVFFFWPTFLNDKVLELSPEVFQKLEALASESKFFPDPKNFYFGAPNEPIRANAEFYVNHIINGMGEVIQQTPQKSKVLAYLKESLPYFRSFDSEEKDQALHYLTRLITIVGVDSTEELFNVWRYGFPFGWFQTS